MTANETLAVAAPNADAFRVMAITKLAHAKLKELADNHGGVQRLAQEVGISPGTLSSWIYLRRMPCCGKTAADGRGRYWRNVTEAAVNKLCQLTGCSPEALFPGYIRAKLTGKSLVQVQTREITTHQLETAPRRTISYETDFDRVCVATEVKERVAAALSALTKREQAVIKLRFGLDNDGRAWSLGECAHVFKLTRERIRQIEARALRKLQNPSIAKNLVGLL